MHTPFNETTVNTFSLISWSLEHSIFISNCSLPAVWWMDLWYDTTVIYYSSWLSIGFDSIKMYVFFSETEILKRFTCLVNVVCRWISLIFTHTELLVIVCLLSDKLRESKYILFHKNVHHEKFKYLSSLLSFQVLSRDWYVSVITTYSFM